MSLRGMLTDYSKGDNLGWFWRLYWLQKRTRSKAVRDVLTFLLNRSAHRHGGYVGPGADIQGRAHSATRASRYFYLPLRCHRGQLPHLSERYHR